MSKIDADLVREALAGDPVAFEELVKRYQKLVWNIIYHYFGRRTEVEDLAQEVFLKMFRSLASYDSGRPLKAWISRITVNTCFDELRKIKVQKTWSFSDLSADDEVLIGQLLNRPDKGSWSEEEAETSLQILQKALAALGDKDKMAFVLREIEGLSYGEIAQSLGASTELAVRIRVSRARKKLQQLVTQLLSESSTANMA